MRTTLCLLALCILTTTTASAGELFEFGVKVGASVTHPSGLPSEVTSVDDLGFSGGFYAQAGLGDLLAIGAELVYEGRNFSLTTDYQDATSTTTLISENSINLPVMLKIGLPLNFMAEIGVQYSHFTGSDELMQSDGQGLGLLGLLWRPLDKLRIGARFLPGLSPLEIDGFDDLSTNVSHVYVAWALF
jgi:hypothetical protein